MLIVIAQPEEIKLVKMLGYENEPIIITGTGGLNVMKALQNVDRETPIYNIGYAGSNTLPKGEFVKISQSTLYHPHAQYKEPNYHLDNNGFQCYTSTDFITNTEIAEPCVFDMELAFIIALGFKTIKSSKFISDNLSREEYDKIIKE